MTDWQDICERCGAVVDFPVDGGPAGHACTDRVDLTQLLRAMLGHRVNADARGWMVRIHAGKHILVQTAGEGLPVYVFPLPPAPPNTSNLALAETRYVDDGVILTARGPRPYRAQ